MRSRVKLLVVDDQESDRSLLARGLRDLGFEVEIAQDGPSALDLISRRDSSYHVVLTDMQMPGMCGVELTRRIKARDARIDVIVITSQNEIDTVVEATLAGAAGYVIKPPAPREVKNRIDRLLAKHALDKTGCEKENLSILFSDIRGYTEIAEKLDPQDLSRFLNEYLGAMTEILQANRGTLDKYVGDAVMGFWGAVDELSDHASLAVKTGVEMIDRLAELNTGFHDKFGFSIDMGVGINSGPASFGSVGSTTMPTVIGDNVNLASRLEGLNKYYGTRILVSESTFALLQPGEFAYRELDTVKIKGRSVPVTIYEIFSRGAPLARAKESLALYREGLKHYRAHCWPEAIDCFKIALSTNTTDLAAAELLTRCLGFQAAPPAPDWDGSWELPTYLTK